MVIYVKALKKTTVACSTAMKDNNTSGQIYHCNDCNFVFNLKLKKGQH